jgi:hypothetical protein
MVIHVRLVNFYYFLMSELKPPAEEFDRYRCSAGIDSLASFQSKETIEACRI